MPPRLEDRSDPTAGRTGPRPLPLHLLAALTTSSSALAALPLAAQGGIPWDPTLKPAAAALETALAEVDLTQMFAAVANRSQQRLHRMLAGMEAYRQHPYRRAAAAPAPLWREGTTQLLRYGDGTGIPALFIPSLVNRYYVLDLFENHSLLRWLAAHGIAPYVVDWDAPGVAERDFALDDYVCGRLARAQEAAAAAAGAPVHLVGYCMGGNLALALALLRPQSACSLALLATPWDFHAERSATAALLGALAPHLELLLEAFGALPVDILQALFTGLDINLAARKFRRFADLDPASRAAVTFVALEDWLNDGVALTPAAARDCLLGWYQRNETMQRRWCIGGSTIDPADLAMPAMLAIPHRDRIVPPQSAQALATQLPQAQILRPPSGHIGMVVGGRAETGLWQPLLQWLHARAA